MLLSSGDLCDFSRACGAWTPHAGAGTQLHAVLIETQCASGLWRVYQLDSLLTSRL